MLTAKFCLGIDMLIIRVPEAQRQQYIEYDLQR